VNRVPGASIERATPQDGDRVNLRLPHLPDDFYASHDVLRRVQRAARADQVSPDAVLLAVLGRVAATIPVAATVNGRPLNLIVALVGHSGSGKSSSHRVARRLVPLDIDRDGIGVGSGEGIAQAYLAREGGQNVQARDVVTFYVDEGERLLTLKKRDGSTTHDTIRSAWDAETLGQANAQADTTRLLKANTYRFVMTVGLQPPFAADLLADQSAGTPQRFLWAAASDPGAPDVVPSWPGELSGLTTDVTPFCLDADVRRIVQARRHQANVEGGHADPHEAHTTQLQLRVAAILAHLLDDGSRHVTPAVWHMAALIVENSRLVRQELIRDHQQTKTDGMVDTVTTRLEVIEKARDVRHDHHLERVGQVIVNYLERNGTSNRSKVESSVASRDRKTYYNEALARLVTRGVVIADRNTLRLKSSDRQHGHMDTWTSFT